MKTFIINAGPRKNANTAQILKSAQKGAESVGKEAEYIDLYDLSFTGCRSCNGCKRRGIAEPVKCYWKDDLQDIVNRIYKEADHIIIGSPMYFGDVTGITREFLERLLYPTLSYNEFKSLFEGKIDTDVFVTMNGSKEIYDQMGMGAKLQGEFQMFGMMLNGEVGIHPVCFTQQVDDYDKYEMRGMDPEARYESRKNLFPQDLEHAFEVGARK